MHLALEMIYPLFNKASSEVVSVEAWQTRSHSQVRETGKRGLGM